MDVFHVRWVGSVSGSVVQWQQISKSTFKKMKKSQNGNRLGLTRILNRWQAKCQAVYFECTRGYTRDPQGKGCAGLSSRTASRTALPNLGSRKIAPSAQNLTQYYRRLFEVRFLRLPDRCEIISKKFARKCPKTGSARRFLVR